MLNSTDVTTSGDDEEKNTNSTLKMTATGL